MQPSVSRGVATLLDGNPSNNYLSRALTYNPNGLLRGAKHLVAGMCETDFSGYPDCRDDTLKAMQLALNLGMDRRFVIHTPLMWIDKAKTFALAHELAGDAFIDLLVEETHTCYLGDRSHRHAWGDTEARHLNHLARRRPLPHMHDLQQGDLLQRRFR